MARKRSENMLKNDRVFVVFHQEFPPQVEWNQTIWNRELGILKRTLIKQGYTHEEVIDAIRFAKLKGKNVKSMAFIPYIINESKQYWLKFREREAERIHMQQQAEKSIDGTKVEYKPNTPQWLHLNNDMEVD